MRKVTDSCEGSLYVAAFAHATARAPCDPFHPRVILSRCPWFKSKQILILPFFLDWLVGRGALSSPTRKRRHFFLDWLVGRGALSSPTRKRRHFFLDWLAGRGALSSPTRKRRHSIMLKSQNKIIWKQSTRIWAAAESQHTTSQQPSLHNSTRALAPLKNSFVDFSLQWRLPTFKALNLNLGKK